MRLVGEGVEYFALINIATEYFIQLLRVTLLLMKNEEITHTPETVRVTYHLQVCKIN